MGFGDLGLALVTAECQKVVEACEEAHKSRERILIGSQTKLHETQTRLDSCQAKLNKSEAVRAALSDTKKSLEAQVTSMVGEIERLSSLSVRSDHPPLIRS